MFRVQSTMRVGREGGDPAIRTGNRKGIGRSTIPICDAGTRTARRSDFVRLGKKILGASRETGGWAKAAGGAQAQSGAKRCMNSCDALLGILSVSCRYPVGILSVSCRYPVGILSGRAESIKVAQSGANCRVNSCAALLFLQKLLRIGAACRAGGGGAMVLQPSRVCKKVCVC